MTFRISGKGYEKPVIIETGLAFLHLSCLAVYNHYNYWASLFLHYNAVDGEESKKRGREN
jgi:hypothetical protein